MDSIMDDVRENGLSGEEDKAEVFVWRHLVGHINCCACLGISLLIKVSQYWKKLT